MRVADVGVARYDCLEHGVGVGLAQDAQRGLGVDRRVGHGVEEAGQPDLRVEVFAHLLDGLADLHDGIQLEVAGRNRDQDSIRGGEGVDGEPGERGRTVNNDMLIAVTNGVQLGLEARLAVVDGGGQLDVGVGEQDVGGNDVQVGDGGGTHRQRFAVDDGDVDALVGVQLGEIVHQHFGAIGLTVDVDKQNLAAAVGQPGRERDRRRCLADAAFL